MASSGKENIGVCEVCYAQLLGSYKERDTVKDWITRSSHFAEGNLRIDS